MRRVGPFIVFLYYILQALHTFFFVTFMAPIILEQYQSVQFLAKVRHLILMFFIRHTWRWGLFSFTSASTSTQKLLPRMQARQKT